MKRMIHIVLSLALLSGCTAATTRSPSEVRRAGVLRVAILGEDGPLYGLEGSYEEPEAELAAAFADYLGVELASFPAAADASALLEAAEADLVLGAISLDTWSGPDALLTAPIRRDRLCVLSRRDEMLGTPDALGGLRTGLYGGGAIRAMLERYSTLSPSVISDPDAAAEQLVLGGLDALLCREETAVRLLAAAEGALRCDPVRNLPVVEYRAAAADESLRRELAEFLEQRNKPVVSQESTGEVTVST